MIHAIGLGSNHKAVVRLGTVKGVMGVATFAIHLFIGVQSRTAAGHQMYLKDAQYSRPTCVNTATSHV